MKFSFVDKMISSSSFIELCNVVKDYGFDGVEIYNSVSKRHIKICKSILYHYRFIIY